MTNPPPTTPPQLRAAQRPPSPMQGANVGEVIGRLGRGALALMLVPSLYALWRTTGSPALPFHDGSTLAAANDKTVRLEGLASTLRRHAPRLDASDDPRARHGRSAATPPTPAAVKSKPAARAVTTTRTRAPAPRPSAPPAIPVSVPTPAPRATAASTPRPAQPPAPPIQTPTAPASPIPPEIPPAPALPPAPSVEIPLLEIPPAPGVSEPLGPVLTTPPVAGGASH